MEEKKHKFSWQIFSNRDLGAFLPKGPDSNEKVQEDPCDNCGNLTLYGAFISKDLVKPKIASNEAFVCQDCYLTFPDLELDFKDPSHIRVFNPTMNEGLRLMTEKDVFVTVESFLQILEQMETEQMGGRRGTEEK